jgi:hypothetical protein
MTCLSEKLPNGKCKCTLCGKVYRSKDCTAKSICRVEATPEQKEKLLGDKVEGILSSCGVTEESYRSFKAWLLRMPIEEIDCNCKERKEKLNALHQRWLNFKSLLSLEKSSQNPL